MKKCFVRGCEEKPAYIGRWEIDGRTHQYLVCENCKWRFSRNERVPYGPATDTEKVEPEVSLNFLVCNECGEAFSDTSSAVPHEFRDHKEQTLALDHVTYTIKSESEAF